MNKTTLRTILVTIVMLVVALPATADFRWGPTVGANLSTYKFKQNLVKIDQSAGFQLGAVGEIMFPGIGLGMDLGLQYNMHGAKLHLGEYEVWKADGYGTEQSYLHSLQIPINLRFKYSNLGGFEDKIAPFVYGGPVFDITLGHNKLEALEYPGGAFMLQCGVGGEFFKHYQLAIGYCWGMTYELRTKKLDNYSARTQGWKFSLTYLF